MYSYILTHKYWRHFDSASFHLSIPNKSRCSNGSVIDVQAARQHNKIVVAPCVLCMYLFHCDAVWAAVAWCGRWTTAAGQSEARSDSLELECLPAFCAESDSHSVASHACVQVGWLLSALDEQPPKIWSCL